MYIDPGAGSLILQALVAGVLSLGLAFRRSREAAKHFLAGIVGRFRHR